MKIKMDEIDKSKQEDNQLDKASFIISQLSQPEKYQRAILLYLKSYWKEFVGLTFSEHSSPYKLEKRKNWELAVSVDHSMWASELLFHQREIIKKLNRHLEYTGIEVNKLRFRVQFNISFPVKAEKDSAAKATGNKNGENQSTEKIDPKIHKALNNIHDPRLRNSLKKIALLLNQEKSE